MSCTNKCNQGRTCTCDDLPSDQSIIHAEAGNVWFEGAEPDDPMTLKTISYYACIVAGAVATIIILAGAAGWVYETFFN